MGGGLLQNIFSRPSQCGIPAGRSMGSNGIEYGRIGSMVMTRKLKETLDRLRWARWPPVMEISRCDIKMA